MQAMPLPPSVVTARPWCVHACQLPSLTVTCMHHRLSRQRSQGNFSDSRRMALASCYTLSNNVQVGDLRLFDPARTVGRSTCACLAASCAGCLQRTSLHCHSPLVLLFMAPNHTGTRGSSHRRKTARSCPMLSNDASSPPFRRQWREALCQFLGLVQYLNVAD